MPLTADEIDRIVEWYALSGTRSGIAANEALLHKLSAWRDELLPRSTTR